MSSSSPSPTGVQRHSPAVRIVSASEIRSISSTRPAARNAPSRMSRSWTSRRSRSTLRMIRRWSRRMDCIRLEKCTAYGVALHCRSRRRRWAQNSRIIDRISVTNIRCRPSRTWMHKSNPQQPPRRRGTTILELLVVVTVILIVMSLVLITLVKVYHAVMAIKKGS